MIKSLDFKNLTIRKCFHILALILFIPPIIYVSQGKPQAARFCVFSFNCGVVLLVGLEALRASEVSSTVSTRLNEYFRSFCGVREEKTLILSHIYLLLGCSFSVNMSFILLDGGFFNGEISVFALSGVMFLGVGDAVAAVFGSKFGTSLWG
jgi:dolichol kinase